MDIDVDLDMDYDYSFSGSTMGGNISNYSTLRTTDTREREQDYDYGTLNKSSLPVSEDELEKYVRKLFSYIFTCYLIAELLVQGPEVTEAG